tara:strand:+ start:2464 stop:3570 length:1107 start_codon:yes stop_codon:yes gene_type:complete
VDTSFLEKINQYVKSIEDGAHYRYFPSKSGLTANGKKLKLGFSCYALKCLFITKSWNDLSQSKKNEWVNFINSYQESIPELPASSYIDKVFIDEFNKFNLKSKVKNVAKKNLSLFNLYNYESPKKVLENNIRAESKQAISTLFQVGARNKVDYKDFPKGEDEIYQLLNSFNWNKPWHAGAQFSGICVFSTTQLEKDDKTKNINSLIKFIDSKLDITSGLYFENSIPEASESVNGAMKVITGLDWLGLPIHLPEKLIDFCLLQKPSNQGCDLVDLVYVLYRCSKETDYKKNEIYKYFDEIEKIIFSHYKNDEGGFSYYLKKSQITYYGIEITTGDNVADLHGTVLLLWAISMIYDFKNDQNELFNIIKP